MVSDENVSTGILVHGICAFIKATPAVIQRLLISQRVNNGDADSLGIVA